MNCISCGQQVPYKRRDLLCNDCRPGLATTRDTLREVLQLLEDRTNSRDALREELDAVTDALDAAGVPREDNEHVSMGAAQRVRLLEADGLATSIEGRRILAGLRPGSTSAAPSEGRAMASERATHAVRRAVERWISPLGLEPDEGLNEEWVDHFAGALEAYAEERVRAEREACWAIADAECRRGEQRARETDSRHHQMLCEERALVSARIADEISARGEDGSGIDIDEGAGANEGSPHRDARPDPEEHADELIDEYGPIYAKRLARCLLRAAEEAA